MSKGCNAAVWKQGFVATKKQTRSGGRLTKNVMARKSSSGRLSQSLLFLSRSRNRSFRMWLRHVARKAWTTDGHMAKLARLRVQIVEAYTAIGEAKTTNLLPNWTHLEWYVLRNRARSRAPVLQDLFRGMRRMRIAPHIHVPSCTYQDFGV